MSTPSLANLRIPLIYVQWDNSQVAGQITPFRYKTLLIGQKLETGIQSVEQAIRVNAVAQARRYFGAGSMLALMCDYFLRQYPLADLWAVSVADPQQASTAKATITITGQSDKDATIHFLIGGESIYLSVLAGEIDKVLIERLAQLCDAREGLTVVATVDAAIPTQLNILHQHPGQVGNSRTMVVLEQDPLAMPSGLSIQCTEASGGSGAPDIGPILNALDQHTAQLIVCPYTDEANLNRLSNSLEARHQSLQQQDIFAFTSINATYGEISTLGEKTNSPYLSLLTSHYSPTPHYCWAASVAGVVARYGEDDPARPFQTLPLLGVLPPQRKNRLSLEECNQLLYAGIATFNISDNDSVHIQRLITTYKTNDYGMSDASYLDLNTLLTLGFLRRDFRAYLTRKYPRHKLADDNTRFASGEPILTPKVAKAEAIAKFREWEARGLVQDIDQFQQDLVVERDSSDPNRLNITLSPRLVNQLRVIGVQLQFLL